MFYIHYPNDPSKTPSSTKDTCGFCFNNLILDEFIPRFISSRFQSKSRKIVNNYQKVTYFVLDFYSRKLNHGSGTFTLRP
jgi:hypothetical protein